MCFVPVLWLLSLGRAYLLNTLFSEGSDRSTNNSIPTNFDKFVVTVTVIPLFSLSSPKVFARTKLYVSVSTRLSCLFNGLLYAMTLDKQLTWSLLVLTNSIHSPDLDPTGNIWQIVGAIVANYPVAKSVEELDESVEERKARGWSKACHKQQKGAVQSTSKPDSEYLIVEFLHLSSNLINALWSFAFCMEIRDGSS